MESILGIIVLALTVLFLVWLLVMYNRLLPYRLALGKAWGNLNSLMNQRYSVLNNFMEFVKGYIGHERQVLREVTEARSMAMKTKDPKEKSRQDAILSDNIVKIFGLTENYPDLKADQRFKDLEGELVKLESKIQYGRSFYNDTVADYRNYRDRLPTIIAAWILGFRKPDFFDAPAYKKEEIKADFSKFYAA